MNNMFSKNVLSMGIGQNVGNQNVEMTECRRMIKYGDENDNGNENFPAVYCFIS